KTINYQPVTAGNQSNPSAGVQEQFDAEKQGRKVFNNMCFFMYDLLVLKILRTLMMMLPLEVNAIDSPVPAVGQISTNSTNTFSAVGPSNTAVSLTHGKSLYVNTSQYPNDLNMPELEGITYSDDEEDVGTEAPIPTTKVHKDHPVTQIIGDLSSATQTRSVTWVAKDQGGLSQINNDDFHTCMFACFLSQEEPKMVHQALKDPS
nr:hypothetical protein [Tanacetum cinerariifolium]